MTDRPREHAHVPPWLALAGATFIGAIAATQSRINGQLGLRLGDGFVAAVISFGTGLIVLIALSLILPSGRRGAARVVSGLRDGGIPLWMLLGGVCGASVVAAQGLVVGVIGVSLFTVGFVAGQTVSGLGLDRIGFGPGGVVPITLPRVVGGALSLLAVGLTLAGGVGDSIPLWMVILPFISGLAVGWQQAVNGRIRRQVGSPISAALVNFAGGTIVLLIAAGISVAINGMPEPAPSEWWIYIGGSLGVIFITLSAVIVAYTGVLLLVIGTIVGQLVAAIVIDLIWPVSADHDVLRDLLVVAVAMASVLVVMAPWSRLGRVRRKRRERV